FSPSSSLTYFENSFQQTLVALAFKMLIFLIAELARLLKATETAAPGFEIAIGVPCEESRIFRNVQKKLTL
ncbi:MAG: hypothetical protein ACE5IW_08665, partial [bacterium]